MAHLEEEGALIICMWCEYRIRPKIKPDGSEQWPYRCPNCGHADYEVSG